VLIRVACYFDDRRPVFAIDQKGIVQTVNPAVEKVFGFSPNEVVGKNIKMLMPKPYFSEHDGYLESYLRTGKKEIINMVREVQGLHKNGSTFPHGFKRFQIQ
jgi:PAS domain S-box-containing protein